jgi:hypothetical protein
MGRPPLNLDKTVIRLSAETRKRIEALEGKRGTGAFIRDAVERELIRREKAVRPKRENKVTAAWSRSGLKAKK